MHIRCYASIHIKGFRRTAYHQMYSIFFVRCKLGITDLYSTPKHKSIVLSLKEWSLRCYSLNGPAHPHAEPNGKTILQAINVILPSILYVQPGNITLLYFYLQPSKVSVIQISLNWFDSKFIWVSIVKTQSLLYIEFGKCSDGKDTVRLKARWSNWRTRLTVLHIALTHWPHPVHVRRLVSSMDPP